MAPDSPPRAYADIVSPLAYLCVIAALSVIPLGFGPWPWAIWLAAAAGPLLLIGWEIRERMRLRTAQRLGRRRNARLGQLATVSVHDVSIDDATPEYSQRELATLRWVLDRALQPINEWSWLDRVDEYLGFRGVRYQLNWLQWALALGQATHTPAFGGYLAQGQRNLIVRALDKRVWGYWRRENILGNLAADPDPIPRENIMYSGYLALMLGTYAAATRDRRYDAGGCLGLRWDADTVFCYDHRAVVDAVERNFAHSRWGMFACEPGLVFPVCNAIALLAVRIRDALDGTNRSAPLLPAFRRTLEEEYTAADGDIVAYLSKRYGFTMRSFRGAGTNACLAFFIRPLLPDVAERIWYLLQCEVLSTGKLLEPGRGLSRAQDMGTGRPSPVFGLANCMLLARELGEERRYRELLAVSEEVLGYADHEADEFVDRNPLLHGAAHLYLIACRILFWAPIIRADPVPLTRSLRVRQLMIFGALVGTLGVAAILATLGHPSAAMALSVGNVLATVLAITCIRLLTPRRRAAGRPARKTEPTSERHAAQHAR